MRLLFKLLGLLILVPVALLLLVLAGIAAIVGVPMLWENLVAKLTAPPPKQDQA